jgi:hypothetical protein
VCSSQAISQTIITQVTTMVVIIMMMALLLPLT